MIRLSQQKNKVPQCQKQGTKHFPWMRLSIIIIALPCITAGVLLSGGGILQGATIFAALSIVFAVLQWLFPFPSLVEEVRKSFSSSSLPSPLLSSAEVSISHGASGAASSNARDVSQSKDDAIKKGSGNADLLNVSKLTSRKDTVMIQSRSAFHYNRPLVDHKEFYGRVRERDTLLKRSYEGGSTSIVGASKMGTSWLICYLKLTAPTQLGSQFRVVYLDATSPNCKTKTSFVAAVLKELGSPVANANQGLAKLERVIKSFKADNRTLIICIDGFEGLNNPQEFDLEFFTGLRSLAQAGLVLVSASKEPLVQACPILARSVVNPLFNIFDQIRLKPFSDEDAKEFVEDKCAQAVFNPQEATAILKYGSIAANRPLGFQLAGWMLSCDKELAATRGPQYYRPHDPDYWQEFEERFKDKLSSVGVVI